MAIDTMKPGSLSRLRRREASEFRLIFLATYPVFLIAATVSRPFRGSTGRSVFGDAKAAAYTCIPFAFM